MAEFDSCSCGRLLRHIGLIALLTASSCRDGTAPMDFPQPRVKPEWVAGQAAAALDTVTGLFRLPTPSPQYTSLAAAEALAIAVARLYGSSSPFNGGAQLETERGAPIDFNRLSPCKRATYANSVFADFPANVPNYIRRAWGHAWAIPLCGDDGRVQLSIGVPDNPWDIRVVDGMIEIPDGGSSADWISAGVPLRFPWSSSHT
jgi:hypothetical protein